MTDIALRETDARDVNTLVRANFLSQLADQLCLTSIPLIAVMDLDLGPGGVGMLNAFQTLPYFLLSIPLGVVVDRASKRDTMLATETLRLLALLAIVASVSFGAVTLPTLAGLAFLAAVGSVGFNVTLPAYLPALVDKSQLTFFNGRLELVRSAGLALGPALAGAAASWFGATRAFGLGAVLTLFTIVQIAAISSDGRAAAGRPKKAPLRDIAEGARFIFASPQLSAIMAVAFCWNCGWFALQAGFMPLAAHTWGWSAGTIGLVLSCMGVGLMAGSLLSQRIVKRLGFGASLAFGPVVSSLASLLALADAWAQSPALAGAAFFLFGFGPVVWVITSTTLRQTLTPGAMLGCVSAMFLTANWGARPFGALIGAAVGAGYGGVACLAASTALFFVQATLVIVSGLTRARLAAAE